ncbi:hypothetical protein AXG93_896s1000 [Marchantia polymorpha subsp. ruderalis]|uniref:Uncharacterized protein n=1 Tax=Marchantia polymorpha subsp. ruderalis TaxID=1480154 RepID=A0A176WF43_MARPO|nr:hypothetical protein AXG93_896s1000 [Marchantia polymorpha subsp. ruderalis]
MRKSPPMVFRLSRPRSETSSLSSSSSRFNFPTVVRNGQLFQLHRGQADMDAENRGKGSVPSPHDIGIEVGSSGNFGKCYSRTGTVVRSKGTIDLTICSLESDARRDDDGERKDSSFCFIIDRGA